MGVLFPAAAHNPETQWWWLFSHFSRVWLFVTPWTVAHQALLSVRLPRQEHWSELPFLSPGNLPNPGIKPASPTLQTDSLLTEPAGNHSAKTWTQAWKRTVCSWNSKVLGWKHPEQVETSHLSSRLTIIFHPGNYYQDPHWIHWKKKKKTQVKALT